jgi:phosphoribosylglycinamide formyltransferase-1
LLQAVLDAAADPGYPARVVAVGADRTGIEGLARAERAGLPAFSVLVGDYPSRDAWNDALVVEVAAHQPDLVVSAGFLKLLSAKFLALGYGVKVTGCTVHLVDDGIDTGPVLAQCAVPVHAGDTEDSLHERIKIEERRLLVESVAALARHGATVTGREVNIP